MIIFIYFFLTNNKLEAPNRNFYEALIIERHTKYATTRPKILLKYSCLHIYAAFIAQHFLSITMRCIIDVLYMACVLCVETFFKCLI